MPAPRPARGGRGRWLPCPPVRRCGPRGPEPPTSSRGREVEVRGGATISAARAFSSQRGERHESARAATAPAARPRPVAGDVTSGPGLHADHARAVQRDESTDAFALQNSKLLKVVARPGDDPGQARARWSPTRATSRFEHAGSGGMSRMLKKAVTGEGQTLMKIDRHRRGLPRRPGPGHPPALPRGRQDHRQRAATCWPSTPDIDWDIERVQGASAMMGGGLFNTVAARHRLGRDPLRRPARAARRRLGADVRRRAGRDHLVVGRHDVAQDRLQAQEPRSARLGRVASRWRFTGQGWVLVQPSEGRIRSLRSRSSGGAAACSGNSRLSSSQAASRSC